MARVGPQHYNGGDTGQFIPEDYCRQENIVELFNR